MQNNFLPGASTVHFEDVIKERIFKKLNTTNLKTLKALRESYTLVKFKLGHAPMMMDFIAHGDKDPYLFVEYKKSYYNFKQHVDHAESTLTALHTKLLEFISLEIANGKRLEEIVLLKYLLSLKEISVRHFEEYLLENYGVPTNVASVEGAVNVLSMGFIKEADAKKYGSLPLVKLVDDRIILNETFEELYANPEFKAYVDDALEYGEQRFLADYDSKKYYHGFKLYGSYTRKDACRILNWAKDESSVVYGYKIKYDTCPIFVTYEKSKDISDSTKYEDRFIDCNNFHWLTRSRVNLFSKEVTAIEKAKTLKLLFIKKSDDEGAEFYFMGEVTHKRSIGSSIKNNDNELSIVEILYAMNVPVEPKLYKYFEG